MLKKQKILLFIFVNSFNITAFADCGENPAPGVNWKGCNKGGLFFKNIDLSNSRLYKTNFTGASFAATDFDDADATRANFSYANLSFGNQQVSGTYFIKTHLTGTDFSYSTCNGCFFGGSFTADQGHGAQAIFNSVKYTKVEFPKAILPYASFQLAQLTDVKFNNTELNNANFSNSTIKNTLFDHTLLNMTDFRNSKIKAIFQYSKLINSNFANANLQKAIFTNCNLTNANFLQTKMAYKIIGEPDVIFENTNLSGAKFAEEWPVLKKKIKFNSQTNFTNAVMGNYICKSGSIGQCK